MDKRDIRRRVTVIHRTTGVPAIIVALEDDSVVVDPFDTAGQHTRIPLWQFVVDYKTQTQPNGLPTFAIEVLPNPGGTLYVQSVRVTPVAQDLAWVDDKVPLVLRATSEGLAALGAYLTAVGMADAWLGRECDGNGGSEDRNQPIATAPGWSVHKIVECSYQRYPEAWYGVAVSPSDHNEYDEMKVYPQLAVRDNWLADQILDAVAAGHLTLER